MICCAQADERRRPEIVSVSEHTSATVPELFDLEWQNVNPSLPPLRGLEGARTLVGMLKAGCPDFTSRIDLIAAEDERVAVRASHSGIHQGAFLGIPPTGKQVTITATGIFTCKHGKLVENRAEAVAGNE